MVLWGVVLCGVSANVIVLAVRPPRSLSSFSYYKQENGTQQDYNEKPPSWL
jgi:hypothetical protein